MALELVGGALLSSVLNVLFDRLAPRKIPNFLRGIGKEQITNLLGELRTVVKMAKRLVNDAEEKQITDDDVREWLDELNDMVYRTEDLVETIDSEAQRQELEGDGSSGSAGFDETVQKEATEILGQVKRLLEQKDNLGLREGVEKIPPSIRPPIPLAEESSVCGRKGDKEAIIDLLLSGNGTGDRISVIPITGMGGIGKTTLAQLVYSDAKVKKHFAVRAWLTVSDDFDINKITKAIFEKVKSEECRTQELFDLQHKLRDALRGNLFLLVLDDVWNENYNLWESLKSSFESGAEGSKIVVTTRSTGVAAVMDDGKTTIYPLTTLSTNDSWQLFAKHAFGSNADPDAHQDLQAIGREIVNKCEGLPLAIKSLGGLLRSERNLKKWENILKSDVWDEIYRNESGILPALWLSYRHMPMHLKRCFSYCSIFPKDYEFQKERIILLWMAEEFLQSNQKSVTMEELGEEYFEDLLSRSLFQKSTGQGESIFIMHDLVHDLAVFVSGRFCFRLDESNDLSSLGSQTRYLSHSSKATKFEGIGNAKCLRTCIQLPLDGYPSSAHSCLEELLTSGRFLRVLSLSRSSIKELSSSIRNLIHLRYLDVSGCDIKELPGSVCSLYNLQTLLLAWCHHLAELPKNMEKLVNLRHLDIQGVRLKEMRFQIKKMKSLQTLNKIVVGGGDELSPKINELKGVQPFQGKLAIYRIENVGDANEALEANMKDKKGLLDLKLNWSLDSFGDAISSEKEREILDALGPHTTIKYLTIESYRGTIFSEWVGHDSFSNVVSIYLHYCKSCVSLPPLGQLPSLEKLTIRGFESVERVGDEFYGNSCTSFRCLETLRISDMAQWKEWSLFGGEGRVVFPHLSSLSLLRCPKLNISLRPNTAHPRTAFLSVGSSSKLVPLSKLENLDLSDCARLQRLSSLQRLSIYDWEGESFPPDGFLAANLVAIYLKNCKKLVALNGKAFQQLTSLEELRIIDCPELRCLPEEGLPASLSLLWIEQCPLLKQRCEEDKGEDWPKISHIADVELF